MFIFANFSDDIEPTNNNGCGPNHTTVISNSQSGEIYSPNYPDVYPNNANCSWQIDADSGDVVTLTFAYMDLGQR